MVLQVKDGLTLLVTGHLKIDAVLNFLLRPPLTCHMSEKKVSNVNSMANAI